MELGTWHHRGRQRTAVVRHGMHLAGAKYLRHGKTTGDVRAGNSRTWGVEIVLPLSECPIIRLPRVKTGLRKSRRFMDWINIMKTALQLHTSSVHTMTAMLDNLFHKRISNLEMSSQASILCYMFTFASSSQLRKKQCHRLIHRQLSQNMKSFRDVGVYCDCHLCWLTLSSNRFLLPVFPCQI